MVYILVIIAIVVISIATWMSVDDDIEPNKFNYVPLYYLNENFDEMKDCEIKIGDVIEYIDNLGNETKHQGVVLTVGNNVLYGITFDNGTSTTFVCNKMWCRKIGHISKNIERFENEKKY